MVRSPLTSWVLLAGVLVLILMQAYHPWWRTHLEADIGTFHARAVHFLKNGTWAGMEYNEYQPGALWFFVFVASFTANFANYDAYLTAIIFINVLLIVLHFLLFERFSHRAAPLVFVALVAAAGPILLYRFELLVSLLTVCAWVLFRRNRMELAALLTGLAVSIKLYPIVLFPLLVAPSLKARDWAECFRTSLFFGIGVLAPVTFAVQFGATITDILHGIAVHGLKPVGLEGLWGAVVTALQWILSIPLHITPGFGVHGLTSDLPFLSNTLLNSIWILPTGIVLFCILYVGRKRGFTDPGYACLLLLTFLTFSKVVNPQYLWWATAFIPLMPVSWFGRETRKMIVFIVLACLLVTQIVYPLYYTEFLKWYDGASDTSPFLFTIMAIRNVVMVALVVIGTERLFHLPKTAA